MRAQRCLNSLPWCALRCQQFFHLRFCIICTMSTQPQRQMASQCGYESRLDIVDGEKGSRWRTDHTENCCGHEESSSQRQDGRGVGTNSQRTAELVTWCQSRLGKQRFHPAETRQHHQLQEVVCVCPPRPQVPPQPTQDRWTAHSPPELQQKTRPLPGGV